MDAIEATRLAFSRHPPWVRTLMGLRNRLGRLVGLKPAPASGFPVIRQSADEVVLGFDDRHLDFRVVVAIAGGFATVTTLVRWHNAWGRAYLTAIMPFHRAIAARMISGSAEPGRAVRRLKRSVRLLPAGRCLQRCLAPGNANPLRSDP